jgi:hypothetical protein
MQADKIKPQSTVTWSCNEVVILPGTNEVLFQVLSSDGEVKNKRIPLDVTDVVDGYSAAIIDQVNTLFNQFLADALEVEDSAITGELFVQTSS